MENEGGLGGEELDVVGVADFDGGGEYAGELDKEAFLAGAFDFEEGAFVAVEGPLTYHAHFGSVHAWSDFVGMIVLRGLDGCDGCYELVHLRDGHGHGCAVGCAFEKSVL